MQEWYLIAILFLATVVGTKLLREIPSLLHTPLMSGMNALSGITVLGTVVVLGQAVSRGDKLLAALAAVLAAINVVGGFAVTRRMLRMFAEKGDDDV